MRHPVPGGTRLLPGLGLGAAGLQDVPDAERRRVEPGAVRLGVAAGRRPPARSSVLVVVGGGGGFRRRSEVVERRPASVDV